MEFDTIILGAGAAGMMCAAQCDGAVLLIDQAKAPGEKIRISGGGRCNFTNIYCAPDRFLSANPHFAKSALARYRPQDFLALVERYGIAWHEKTLGQLFCDGSARQIVAMLRDECANAALWLGTRVAAVQRDAVGFVLKITRGQKSQSLRARNLVLATGGKSIPKMGASGLAYEIAAQFSVPVTQTRAGLVPLTFSDGRFAALSGLSVPARVRTGGVSFNEALLFTHRGLSGPAILQASSYWREGEDIRIALCPGTDFGQHLRETQRQRGRQSLSRALSGVLPARLAEYLRPALGLDGRLADQSGPKLDRIAAALHDWQLRPSGSEGYRTAEVTLGGIDTAALDARSMAVRAVPGLYAIGEAVDVTGWLGGYNFQWAWASGHAAGQAIRQGRG